MLRLCQGHGSCAADELGGVSAHGEVDEGLDLGGQLAGLRDDDVEGALDGVGAVKDGVGRIGLAGEISDKDIASVGKVAVKHALFVKEEGLVVLIQRDVLHPDKRCVGGVERLGCEGVRRDLFQRCGKRKRGDCGVAEKLFCAKLQKF